MTAIFRTLEPGVTVKVFSAKPADSLEVRCAVKTAERLYSEIIRARALEAMKGGSR